MKVALVLFATLLALAACEREDAIVSTAGLPPCVQDFIDVANRSDRTDTWTVSTHPVDGERHYWLGTGAPAYDGVDYIVNTRCDTVCAYGGFRPALDCARQYNGQWLEIWRG